MKAPRQRLEELRDALAWPEPRDPTVEDVRTALGLCDGSALAGADAAEVDSIRRVLRAMLTRCERRGAVRGWDGPMLHGCVVDLVVLSG